MKKTARHLAAAALAASGLAILTGCTSSAPASPRTAALSWMRSHPAPRRAGTVTGVVMRFTFLGEQSGTAYGWPLPPKPGPEQVIRCPANALYGPVIRTTAALRGLPACHSWKFSLLSPAGRTVTVTCGGPGHPCLAYPWVFTGEYVRVPADGRVVTDADLRVIKEQVPG